jgi:peptide deformylase
MAAQQQQHMTQAVQRASAEFGGRIADSLIADPAHFAIKKIGDSCLRAANMPVKDFSHPILPYLLRAMEWKMYHSGGIGIAAPQLGINLQICVIDTSNCRENCSVATLDNVPLAGDPRELAKLFPLHLINPEITEYSAELGTAVEGCLSIPGVNAPVARPILISVHYQSNDGGTHALHADGMLARCIQHEVDHLRGILFIDYGPQ